MQAWSPPGLGRFEVVEWVVWQEHGPVVDAVVGYQTPDGHGHPAHGSVGLGHGEAGGEAGTEVGAVEIRRTGSGRTVAAGPEIGGNPGVAETDIVERSRPVKGYFWSIIPLGSLPSVVDDSCGVVFKA